MVTGMPYVNSNCWKRGYSACKHAWMILNTNIHIACIIYTDATVLQYICPVFLLQAAAELLSSIEASGASGSTRLCEPPPRNKVQGIVCCSVCTCVYMQCVHIHECTWVRVMYMHACTVQCINVSACMECFALHYFNRSWTMSSGS